MSPSKKMTSKPTSGLGKRTGIETRKVAAARKIGSDSAEIASVRLDIESMRQKGVLIDVDVHGLSLLTQRATWAELGIPDSDVRRKRLKRGSKDLFPGYINKFNSLSTRFRYSVEEASYLLEGFKPYRWVPYTSYKDWREKWDKLQSEWADLLAAMLADYDEIERNARRDARKDSHEAWTALLARYRDEGGDPTNVVIIVGDQTFKDEKAFTQYVVSRQPLPSRDVLQTNLYVTYRTALVLSGSDLEAEAAQQARFTAEKEQAWATQRTAQIKVETERAKARAEQEIAETRTHEEKIKAQMRLEAEQDLLEAMHRAEMERARAQLAQTISPLAEAIEQLRARVHDDVIAMIGSIRKNGHVRGKVAERARNVLRTFQLLNANDDDALEAELTNLTAHLPETNIKKEGQRYDTQAVLAQLETIAELTHQEAVNVALRTGSTTRASALEL